MKNIIHPRWVGIAGNSSMTSMETRLMNVATDKEIKDCIIRSEFAELMFSDPSVGMYGAGLDEAEKDLSNPETLKDWAGDFTPADIHKVAQELRKEMEAEEKAEMEFHEAVYKEVYKDV